VSSEPSDVELLQRWRAGDTAAANVLLRRHFAAVFRYFDAHVRGADVEDLTQRTFEACVEFRDRLRDDASLRAYLMGIARKQLLKHLERKRPRGHEVPHSQVDLVDIRTSPTGVLARLDQQRVFLDALLPLAPEYREVIELYFWQDRKIPEIAAALEIAVGTVKSRLHRGKAAMRAAIEAMGIAPQLRAGTLGELDSRPIDDD